MSLDPSIYQDLTCEERFRLAVAAQHREDYEELDFLDGLVPRDPSYTERCRRFQELAALTGNCAQGFRIAALQAADMDGYDLATERMKAVALAWGDFCGDISIDPAGSVISFYRAALANSRSHQCHAATRTEWLQILRLSWTKTVGAADTAKLMGELMARII